MFSTICLENGKSMCCMFEEAGCQFLNHLHSGVFHLNWTDATQTLKLRDQVPAETRIQGH